MGPCLNHCHCIEIIKMARGGKRGHKGGRKQFSNPQALEAANAKAAKEKEWRRQRGEDVSDTESKMKMTRKRTVVQMMRPVVLHSRRSHLSQNRSQNQKRRNVKLKVPRD